MKRWLKNDNGFTLIELLASIALLSVVILLGGSIHIFGQSQFINQTESARQSNDLRYSLSVISRDVRMADSVSSDESTLIADGMSFKLEGTQLQRIDINNNSEVLSDKVSSFIFSEDPDSLKVTIESTKNRQGQSKKYETTIYFRR